MSTQKKDDSAKIRSRNTSGDTQTLKGKGAEGQRHSKTKAAGTNERKPTNESKRPTVNNKKN